MNEWVAFEAPKQLLCGGDLFSATLHYRGQKPETASLTIKGGEKVLWEEEQECVTTSGKDRICHTMVVEQTGDGTFFDEQIDLPELSEGYNAVPFSLRIPEGAPASCNLEGKRWGMKFECLCEYVLSFEATVQDRIIRAQHTLQVTEKPPLHPSSSSATSSTSRWRQCLRSRPRHGLELHVATDKRSYNPGESIRCTVDVNNKTRKPVAIELKLTKTLTLTGSSGREFSHIAIVSSAGHGGVSARKAMAGFEPWELLIPRLEDGSVSVLLRIPQDTSTQCLGNKIRCSYTISLDTKNSYLTLPVSIRAPDSRNEDHPPIGSSGRRLDPVRCCMPPSDSAQFAAQYIPPDNTAPMKNESPKWNNTLSWSTMLL